MAIEELKRDDLDQVSGGATYEIKKIDDGWGGKPSFVPVRSDALGYYNNEADALKAIERIKKEENWMYDYLDRGPGADDL